MNAETLMKALKCCASSETGCIDCPNIDLVIGRCSTELDTIAIDVIESLQAQLERFNATLAREGFTELETIYDMAIKALERQMPKEPAHKDGDYFCQVCGTYCGNVHDGMQKYCDECGQRLK